MMVACASEKLSARTLVTSVPNAPSSIGAWRGATAIGAGGGGVLGGGRGVVRLRVARRPAPEAAAAWVAPAAMVAARAVVMTMNLNDVVMGPLKIDASVAR